jgi:multidrug efflux system membrane fusion protein
MQQYHGTERPALKELPVIKLLKRALAMAVVAGLAGLIFYASTLPSVQKQFTGRRARLLAEGPVPVTAARAQISDVPLYLEGVGTAKARNTVTVRPQVDGRILSINFKEGHDVKRGDVLAKIDPSTYQAQLDQALAKKVLDEADLANARRDLDRYVKLGANIVSQKSIDTQVATVDKLAAQIKVDEASIANAKAYLEYCTILAPIDGRTGIRLVDEGNLVRGSDASQGIVVITELRPVSVLFTLPQQQLAKVQKAQAKGALTVEALDTDGKATLDRGTLQVVDNQVDPTTGTVRMKAEFPNASLQLWPGQFVNVGC